MPDVCLGGMETLISLENRFASGLSENAMGFRGRCNRAMRAGWTDADPSMASITRPGGIFDAE